MTARIYSIVVREYIDLDWAEWFDGLTITYTHLGETRITGLIVDQAALFGILNKVDDLGLELVSLVREEDNLCIHNYSEE